MKKNDFLDTMKLGGKRTLNLLKEWSPEIAFGLGAILMIKGTIEACKATPEWMDDYKSHLEIFEKIEKQHDVGELTDAEETTAVLKESWELSKDFTKKYCKSIIYHLGGLALEGYAVKTLRTRSELWKDAFKDAMIGTLLYRGRVADFVGKDKEFELFHNIKKELVEEEYVDENGKKKKRKAERVVDPEGGVRGGHNSYWFGQGDEHWQGVKDIDRQFIIDAEMMFNRILVGRGHGAKLEKGDVTKFMKWDRNDPYKYEAHTMGWVYNENGKYEMYKDRITGKDTDLPRIIKFTTSCDFDMEDDPCGETWVDLNCYPIEGILKQMESDILDDIEERRRVLLGA